MKKLIFIVICTLAFAGVVFATDADMDLSVTLSDGRTFTSTEAGEVFLPSYTDPTEIVFNFAKTGISYESSLTNKKIGISSGDKLDITEFKKIDGTYSVKFYDGDTEYAYTVFISSSLPSIHITTSIGKDKIVSQYPQTDTNVKTAIINKNGKYEYVDTEHMHGELKVRGNTTDTYAKKPFQLKLNEKKNLFGMGEAKTWILLANYLDQSFIRNSVMYKLGSLIGMDACEFQSVDLFLDGEYYGVYLLCEKVQIGKSRVNITDLEKENDKLNAAYGSIVSVTSGELIDKGILREYRYINGVTDPEDITGGYLVELDNNNYRSEKCYFITTSGNAYVVKSPENASKAQMEYIAEIFGYMEEALASGTGYNSIGKHYSEYVDKDSLAYAYIMAEYGRNYDAGSSSTYFYKDVDLNGNRTKITSGPLWDCDNTLGNILKGGAAVQEGYWAANRPFWNLCVKHSDFNSLVKKHFERMYDIIYDMVDRGGYIDELVSELGTSVAMERARWHSDNYSKWPLYDERFNYHHYEWSPNTQTFQFIKEYSDGVDEDETTVIGYLINCMTDRAEWLATEWNCNVEKRERVLVIQPPQPDTDDPTPDTDDPPPATDTSTDSGSTDTKDTGASSDTGTSSGTVDTGNTSDTNESGDNSDTGDREDSDKSAPDKKIIIGIAVAFAAAVSVFVFIASKKKL